MSLKQIDAILWRKYLQATSDAVWEANNSQWYFELPASDYTMFFDGNCPSVTDNEGNEAFRLSLEPFDGEPPAGQHNVMFTRKRAGPARGGNWTVDSIRDGKVVKAYDLWRPTRGPISPYQQLPPPEKDKNYIVIVRDVERRFHGRWLRGSDFDVLPDRIREILLSKGFGWELL